MIGSLAGFGALSGLGNAAAAQSMGLSLKQTALSMGLERASAAQDRRTLKTQVGSGMAKSIQEGTGDAISKRAGVVNSFKLP